MAWLMVTTLLQAVYVQCGKQFLVEGGQPHGGFPTIHNELWDITADWNYMSEPLLSTSRV